MAKTGEQVLNEILDLVNDRLTQLSASDRGRSRGPSVPPSHDANGAPASTLGETVTVMSLPLTVVRTVWEGICSSSELRAQLARRGADALGTRVDRVSDRLRDPVRPYLAALALLLAFGVLVADGQR